MYEYILTDVIRIIDGDTLDVQIDLGFNIFTIQRIRLAGINAPETRTKDLHEKELGLQSKKFVEDFINESRINGYQVYIKTTIDDKYGRMLGRITSNNKCLNDLLLSNGLAKPYDGHNK